MADTNKQLSQLDMEVAERIRLERENKAVEQQSKEQSEVPDVAAKVAPAPEPVLIKEVEPVQEVPKDSEYKYVRVESLEELKDRVQRVCTFIDEKEGDVYNKRRFPYRLAAIMGSMVFFLALILSFFAEQPPQVVVKRSIGSFFLFGFLGWLIGLVVNYFSPPLSPQKNQEDDTAGMGLQFDMTADAPGEIDDYLNQHELVGDPVEEAKEKAAAEMKKRLAEKQADIDARKQEVALAEKEIEENREETVTRQEAIESLAKEAPEQVANAIRTVLTRAGNE